MSYAEECTRVYLPYGKVAHLKSPVSGVINYEVILCPAWPGWRGDWYGTGSQDEHDRAASLPLCRRCARRAQGEDEYRREPCQFTNCTWSACPTHNPMAGSSADRAVAS